MSRNTYVSHNVYFDSGGPWGMFAATLAAYVETGTGRPFASFYHSVSGTSIGGVNAAAMSIHCPARILLFSTYACSRDLFSGSTLAILGAQFLNSASGYNMFGAHRNHMMLYDILQPHYKDMVMNDAKVSLLIPAHNLTKKRDEFLGKLDPALFDESAMRIPLINGNTRMIDGPMASSAIFGLFPPYRVHDSHYVDIGTVVGAEDVHRELSAALLARQKTLRSQKSAAPLSRRGMLRQIMMQTDTKGPRTLANTDDALVLTLHLGTGDLSGLPYSDQVQINAGIFGMFNDKNYGLMHAFKRSGQQQRGANLERHYNAQARAVTGLPAITTINKSLVPTPGNAYEIANFPSPEQLDCTPENMRKISHHGCLYTAENNKTLTAFLNAVTVNQRAQGEISEDVYAKTMRALAGMEKTPWRILEDLMITQQNEEAIYQQYRTRPTSASNVVAQLASMAKGMGERAVRLVS